MTASPRFDAVIAGAGIAGASVAAALTRRGLRVLLVEPGLDSAKRLAGELIHPPGAHDLAELGLLDPLLASGAATVLGFAVVPAAEAEPFLLPYGEIPGIHRSGFAMDHTQLRSRLFEAVRARAGVTTWPAARVTALDLTSDAQAHVTIATPDGQRSVHAQLVVAADGSTSPLRRVAGIAHTRLRISHMVGYVLPGARLPHPGYGNVFLGGPTPTLAYAIGPDTVRVMFDVPDNPWGLEAPKIDAAYLDALPRPFRDEVRRAVESEPRLVSVNYSVVPEAVVRGRLVLVGDAAGCCHPLTATGLSVSTRDALRLVRALDETGGDILRANRRYAELRGGPQVTRMALAEALYEAFCARTPEMRLLRQGILRFWTRSRRGRSASMALLSTHEGRMSVMALQYARVVGYALTLLIRRQAAASRRRALLGLGWTTLRFARDAISRLRTAR
jgi:2-polyprenyl-6-methoxyphenol hydroxylase-like FAD-dependent oxidoreductase